MERGQLSTFFSTEEFPLRSKSIPLSTLSQFCYKTTLSVDRFSNTCVVFNNCSCTPKTSWVTFSQLTCIVVFICLLLLSLPLFSAKSNCNRSPPHPPHSPDKSPPTGVYRIETVSLPGSFIGWIQVCITLPTVLQVLCRSLKKIVLPDEERSVSSRFWGTIRLSRVL